MSTLPAIEWYLIISFAVLGIILLFLIGPEVAKWLSTTRWFKKYFTKYGG